MTNINENIAKNITVLRKKNKWTQQDLASKLNYSDKSISKWERGDSIPDIEMLYKVAAVFGVSIDFLTSEHSEKEINRVQNNTNLLVRNILILIMACVSVFFISTSIFAYTSMRNIDNASKYWVSYIVALPICSLLCYYYARKCNIWLMKMISISSFVWTLIASIYFLALVRDYSNFWMLFLVGIPIQAAICLFFFWKKTF